MCACVGGRGRKAREETELIEGVERPLSWPATHPARRFSQQPRPSPPLRELTSAGKPVFPVVGLGPPKGAPPFCPSVLLTDPRFRPALPPPSVGPTPLGVTSGEGDARWLLREEGGPEHSWTSLSLNPSGPRWGKQGRVIPRSWDTFGVESVRAPSNPVFLLCSFAQERSSPVGRKPPVGSAPWDGTNCFLCVEPSPSCLSGHLSPCPPDQAGPQRRSPFHPPCACCLAVSLHPTLHCRVGCRRQAPQQ